LRKFVLRSSGDILKLNLILSFAMFVLRFLVHQVQNTVFCSSAVCDHCHSLFSAVSCRLVLTGS